MQNENHSRRQFMRLLGAGAAGAVASPAGLFAQSGKKQNVLFIAVDDLRPQLKCYGHPRMISPNLDRLASSGVLFERAYCNVPVCGASRASLLTGVRPNPRRFISYDTWADKDLPGHRSLPKTFKDNGYYTMSRGKIYHHLADDKEAWHEVWQSKVAFPGYAKKESHDEGRRARGNDKLSRKRGPAIESADVPDNAYADGQIADKAIDDLRRMKEKGQPFFLAAGFMKPHLPFTAPKRYWDLYKREEIDLADNPLRPKGAPDAAIHTWGELRGGYTRIPAKGPLPDEQARELIHGYYACVSFTDAQIGRVLDELERLGLADDTVVVLWGDHGWNLGEHGLWCKHCNFDTSLHAAMLCRAPQLAGGKRTRALTEFVDIYPSLCELAGLPVPAHCEGTSFVPLMKNPGRPWKRAVFSRFVDGDSIVTERYIYSEWKRRKGPSIGQRYARMLYDHQTDPHENTNIAERPENQELVEKLAAQLHAGWKPARPKA